MNTTFFIDTPNYVIVQAPDDRPLLVIENHAAFSVARALADLPEYFDRKIQAIKFLRCCMPELSIREAKEAADSAYDAWSLDLCGLRYQNRAESPVYHDRVGDMRQRAVREAYDLIRQHEASEKTQDPHADEIALQASDDRREEEALRRNVTGSNGVEAPYNGLMRCR